MQSSHCIVIPTCSHPCTYIKERGGGNTTHNTHTHNTHTVPNTYIQHRVFVWVSIGRIALIVASGVPISPMLLALLVNPLWVHSQWCFLGGMWCCGVGEGVGAWVGVFDNCRPIETTQPHPFLCHIPFFSSSCHRYEDDRDEGEWFLYTGSGGRDLSGNKRTNKVQSFDQKFESMNAALKMSCIKGLPVRVVRSYKVGGLRGVVVVVYRVGWFSHCNYMYSGVLHTTCAKLLMLKYRHAYTSCLVHQHTHTRHTNTYTPTHIKHTHLHTSNTPTLHTSNTHPPYTHQTTGKALLLCPLHRNPCSL